MSELIIAPPELEFAVTGCSADPLTAAPALRFAVELSDTSGREIYTVAVTAQVTIDADRRSYDESARGRLLDLFGEPQRIPQTAGNLQWARIEALAPAFTDAGQMTLDVPVSADLELASMRYFNSQTDGTVPLTFHFSGTIFYRGEHDRLKVTLVPWSCSARYRLQLAVWRELIESRYSAGGFVRLQAETIERLRRLRAQRGLHTFDDAIAAALEESE